MRRSRSYVTALFICLQMIVGCSGVRLHQNAGEVIIRDPADSNFPREAAVDDKAAATAILPYAILADQTYKRSYGPHSRLLRNLTSCGPQTCPEEESEARKLLSNWRLLAAEDQFGAPSGLGVQIWVSKGPVCREAVIAFRGSDFAKTGTWVSNLHWLGRIFGVTDQYTQVRYNISRFIDRIVKDPCYRPRGAGKTVVTVVGHSLGGGLARHAGYVDARIDSVYTFDPSFVTGKWDRFFAKAADDPGMGNIAENMQGLTINSTYEHGEVLAYARFITRRLVIQSRNAPHVILTRFNVIEGNIFKQHKLTNLITCLLADANSIDENDRAARRIRRAAECGDK